MSTIHNTSGSTSSPPLQESLLQKSAGQLGDSKVTRNAPNTETKTKIVSSFKEIKKDLGLSKSENKEIKGAMKLAKQQLQLISGKSEDKQVYDLFHKKLKENLGKEAGVSSSESLEGTQETKKNTKTSSIKHTITPEIRKQVEAGKVSQVFAQVVFTTMKQVMEEVGNKEHAFNSPSREAEHTIKDSEGNEIVCKEKCVRHSINQDQVPEGLKHLTSKGWLGSGDFRTAAASVSLGLEDSKALKDMPPVRVNARTHTMEVQGKTLSLDRGAALADFRDGTTNLESLKNQASTIKQELSEQPAFQIITSNEQKIAIYQQQIQIKEDELKQSQGDTHTAKLIQKEIAVLQDDITFCEESSRDALQILDKAGYTEKLNELRTLEDQIQTRQQFVDQLMLQRLGSALESTSFSDRTGNTLLLSQNSLMDEKVEKTKQGFVHSEKNFILDMKSAFSDFQGKPIEFSSNIDKPQVIRDLDGNIEKIVYPESQKPSGISPNVNTIGIHTCLFNVSVQGNIKNMESDTGAINKDGLKDLEAYAEKKFGKNSPEHLAAKNELAQIEKELKAPSTIKGKVKAFFGLAPSQYDVAARLVLLQNRLAGNQGSIGINCFSGKDRTGELVAETMKQFTLQTVFSKDSSEGVEKAQNEASKTLAKGLHDPKSITRQIARENVGVNALKIKKGNISGMNIFERIKMAFDSRKAAA